LRSVGWERFGGQTIQVAATIVLLVLLPSPVHGVMGLVIAAGIVAVLVAIGIAAAARMDLGGRTRVHRIVRAIGSDGRRALAADRAWLVVVVTSLVAVAGHVAVFVMTARIAGVDASPVRLIGLALLVLAAMSVPTNVAGW